jgi:hypothetical protein
MPWGLQYGTMQAAAASAGDAPASLVASDSFDYEDIFPTHWIEAFLRSGEAAPKRKHTSCWPDSGLDRAHREAAAAAAAAAADRGSSGGGGGGGGGASQHSKGKKKRKDRGKSSWRGGQGSASASAGASRSGATAAAAAVAAAEGRSKPARSAAVAAAAAPEAAAARAYAGAADSYPASRMPLTPGPTSQARHCYEDALEGVSNRAEAQVLERVRELLCLPVS